MNYVDYNINMSKYTLTKDGNTCLRMRASSNIIWWCRLLFHLPHCQIQQVIHVNEKNNKQRDRKYYLHTRCYNYVYKTRNEKVCIQMRLKTHSPSSLQSYFSKDTIKLFTFSNLMPFWLQLLKQVKSKNISNQLESMSPDFLWEYVTVIQQRWYMAIRNVFLNNN
jgi:hypothetical protein